MTKRTCRICGTEKPSEDFYFRKDSGKYRSECKECLNELIRYKQTGWTQTDYDKALIKQEGRCAICNCELNSTRYTKLAVDHCHKTGKLRGLLCTNCNTGLGLFKESKERFESAIRYLEQHS